MRNVLVFILLSSATNAFGQSRRPVTIIDFVKIKANKTAEALFYYEQNWKAYREVMLKKEFIKSYQLLTTKPDSLADFDLMLLTEYADSTQFALSEERFQRVIQEMNPNGPKLLNALKPADFRINLFFRKAETVYSSETGKTH